MKVNSQQELLEAYKQGERDFSFSDLDGANLEGANLDGADLIGANLYGANLRDANLERANLIGADLYGANLKSANLIGADLYGANLKSANLERANLRDANLERANLIGAKNLNPLIASQLLVCPEYGSFYAYKQAKNKSIVLLFIPEDAKRSSATTRKCRASKARVEKIWDIQGNEIDITYSIHDPDFQYKVGEWVYPDKWEEDRWIECGGGIHFFMTRLEAENY